MPQFLRLIQVRPQQEEKSLETPSGGTSPGSRLVCGRLSPRTVLQGCCRPLPSSHPGWGVSAGGESRFGAVWGVPAWASTAGPVLQVGQGDRGTGGQYDGVWATEMVQVKPRLNPALG